MRSSKRCTPNSSPGHSSNSNSSRGKSSSRRLQQQKEAAATGKLHRPRLTLGIPVVQEQQLQPPPLRPTLPLTTKSSGSTTQLTGKIWPGSTTALGLRQLVLFHRREWWRRLHRRRRLTLRLAGTGAREEVQKV